VNDWDATVEAWSHPPVDDVGYLPAADLLALPDNQLRRLVDRMRSARYQGWRNFHGLWRDVLGLDSTHGKDVLDFGCGAGVEALELALAGNRVALADISGLNVQVAYRVLCLYRDQLTHMHDQGITLYLISDEPPFIDCPPGSFDVFHCCGVLHHIPWARQIMERAHQLLRPAGEARLMLYSDEGWRIATGTEPPDEVTAHPDFERFVRYYDQVGDYADWYDPARIEERFGDLFDVVRCEYLTPNRRYLAAVLRRKETT
jgi:SAM-dependent methyltransferase